MKKIFLLGIVLTLAFLFFTQKTDKKFPIYPLTPEKNASTVDDDVALRDVVLVGNNWGGTITIFDAETYEIIKKISAIPDREERFDEIYTGLKNRFLATFIKEVPGEGNDQLVDDMFLSNDGRYIFASRPSFADVVSIDINSGEIVWRTKIEGSRSDHSAISPDGKTFLVSASTARKVIAINTENGEITGSFESGDAPHENNYSKDGSKIFHASIGRVFIPSPTMDAIKGDRWFQIVDAKTYEILKRIDIKDKIEEAGFESVGRAIRPMAITTDEKFAYLQVSYFHGFFEYDIENDKITRKLELPNNVKNLSYSDYQLNSAHHGIAMSTDDKKLCVAGTMDGYIAIVDRDTFEYKLINTSPEGTPTASKPYWATTSADGTKCYVTLSGIDAVSVIDYATGAEVARIATDDHPQRIRHGKARLSK